MAGKVGCPPIPYDPDTYPLLAEQYAREGLTNKEIAARFGIGKSTFYDWRQKHEPFREALKEGKVVADAKVESAYYHRALGYEYEEVEEIVDLKQTPSGEKAIHKRRVVRKKHVPPDVQACRLWLLNRRPDRWRDKQDLNVSGNLVLNFDKEDADL